MNLIRKTRQRKNMTQSDLAKMIGKTPQLVSLYEQGRREPKLETWRKMAQALQVRVPYLQGYGINDKKFEKTLLAYIAQALIFDVANESDAFFNIRDSLKIFSRKISTPFTVLDSEIFEYVVVEHHGSVIPDDLARYFPRIEDVLGGFQPLLQEKLYSVFPTGIANYGDYGELDKLPKGSSIDLQNDELFDNRSEWELNFDSNSVPAKLIQVTLDDVSSKIKEPLRKGINLLNIDEPIFFHGTEVTPLERRILIQTLEEIREK